MKIEKNNNIKKESKRKNKKDFDLKNTFESYKSFYIENLKMKHVIITIIMLIIYFIMLNFFLNNAVSIENEIANGKIDYQDFLGNLIKEKIPLLAMIIFAGITPFFFLSVIGVIGSYTLALDVCYLYLAKDSLFTVIIGSLGSIVQIIAISLAIATGIYYCIQSSKKFKYNQYVSFGIKDVKKTFYEIRKDEKKLENLYESEKQKAKNREKLNVKIPYAKFLVSFIISTIILTIGVIIVNIA